jgi:hypothetical protein
LEDLEDIIEVIMVDSHNKSITAAAMRREQEKQ